MMQLKTLRVGGGACVLLAAFFLSACEDKSKPDFEAESERLKAYIVNEAPKEAKRLDTDFDGKVRLIGYELSPAKPVKPGQRVTLTLYWQSTKPVEPGYSLFTHVLDGSGERVESLDEEGPLREPREGRPALPPEAWKAGKVYVDELRFKVPKSVKTDKIEVVAGVVRKEERLNVLSGEKDGAGAAKVVSIEVQRPAPSARERGHVVDAVKLAPKQKIAIDGKLDEEAWATATALPLGDPKAVKAVPVADMTGTVKLLWSDTGFYAGFDVADQNVTRQFDDNVPGHVTDNDAVEILIDPEGQDNKDYYELQISPVNGVFDTRFDEFKKPAPKGGQWGHEDWSAHLKSAASVRGTIGKSGEKGEDKDEGYTIEVFVPWKSLSTTGNRPPPKPGDEWRMNFHAIDGVSALSWSPVNGVSFHRVERFGRVTWSDGSGKPTEAGTGGASGAGGAAARADAAAKAEPSGAGGTAAKSPAKKLQPASAEAPAAKPAVAAPAVSK
jgi:hypothetical protein